MFSIFIYKRIRFLFKIFFSEKQSVLDKKMAKITCSIGSKSSGSGTSTNVKSEIGNIHIFHNRIKSFLVGHSNFHQCKIEKDLDA